MDAGNQKQEERRIFDLVYSGRSLDDVVEHENPDFLARCSPELPYFGVEITEYYDSESNARLSCIPDYVSELLQGEDFRHKDDRRVLEVSEVDIIRNDDTVRAKSVPAVLQRVPVPGQCARQVAQRMCSKARRLQASTAEISHANLVIQDKTGLLRQIAIEDFYRIYFVPELVAAITTVPFREVFLVTMLQNEHVYAPLKMLHLLAEAYFFNGVVVQKGFAKQIPAGVAYAELFAAYLNSTSASTVLVHDNTAGTEVIFGDAGVLIDNENFVTVRLHSDCPISPDAVAPNIDWKAVLGGQFHDAMKEYRESHSFATRAVFPVNTSAA